MRLLISTIPKLLFIFFRVCYADDETDLYEYAEDEWASTHGEIIFSAMLFRHGNRTPFEDFPTNPHSDKIDRNGRLTKEGKLSAYRLGVWAKKRYQPLLNGKEYHSELLHVLSSSSERCALSAQLFLAGFFPPTLVEEWNVNIPWQPIPVYTNPPFDRMFTMREYCPRYIYEMERVKSSPGIVNFYNEHKSTVELIVQHGKYHIPEDADPIIRRIQRTSVFFDIMHVQNQLNFETPDWAKTIYPRERVAFTTMYYKLHTYNKMMKRLKGGPLLTHVINELKQKQADPHSEKLFQFYAAHDGNLVALMSALDTWDETLPEYSASLIFELRLFRGNHIVTVSFKPSLDAPLELLEIPKCKHPCALESLIEETKDVVVEDWERDCRLLTPDYNTILF